MPQMVAAFGYAVSVHNGAKNAWCWRPVFLAVAELLVTFTSLTFLDHHVYIMLREWDRPRELFVKFTIHWSLILYW